MILMLVLLKNQIFIKIEDLIFAFLYIMYISRFKTIHYL